jgi:hypothetical protein
MVGRRCPAERSIRMDTVARVTEISATSTESFE